MAIAGRWGLALDLTDLPRTPGVDTDVMALFSESNARFLVEVAPEAAVAFEKALVGWPVARLGAVTDDGVLRLRGIEGGAVVECRVDDLARRFTGAEPAP